MKINFRKSFGIFLVLVSVVMIFISIIWSLAFQFRNPDMTQMRVFLTNPTPSIIAIISILTLCIGRYMLGD